MNALDQLAKDEARALALLLAGDTRHAFVVAIVADEDGQCTMTSAPSAVGDVVTMSTAQVRGFAQGLRKVSDRLFAKLPQEHR